MDRDALDRVLDVLLTAQRKSSGADALASQTGDHKAARRYAELLDEARDAAIAEIQRLHESQIRFERQDAIRGAAQALETLALQQ